MAKFMFIYRDPSEMENQLTPEEMQQVLEKWTSWIGAAMQAGWMINPGDALTPAGRVLKPDLVTDGPFVESKEIVGGFSIVEAPSLEAATELARGCPGLSAGGSVEVRALAGYSLDN
ncbi:MAG: transcription initiation protein [Planctomycetes bacterium]|nr:transcription initiation protein [Planctomycetota bacterium]